MDYWFKANWLIDTIWWVNIENKEGKIRYDLIPISMIKRLAILYTRWAEKYGARNMENWWEEYIEKRKESAYRHFYSYMNWEIDEDHASSLIWNLFTIEFLKDKLRKKDYSSENYDPTDTILK